MELHHGWEMILDDFSHEDSIWEISINIFSWAAEGDGIDPFEDFFCLLLVDGGYFHK